VDWQSSTRGMRQNWLQVLDRKVELGGGTGMYCLNMVTSDLFFSLKIWRLWCIFSKKIFLHFAMHFFWLPQCYAKNKNTDIIKNMLKKKGGGHHP
jgi:hypothetical protein